MSRLIIRWIVLAFAVVVSSAIAQFLGLPFKTQLHTVADFLALMAGVAILAFLNATLGRILKFFTLPLNCLTLGLFSLVINALILLLTASLGIGFDIQAEGAQAFWTAFVASLLISVMAGLLGTFIPDQHQNDE